MAQKDFYQASTFDIAEVALTYSSSSGAGFATVGKMQYFRLDYPLPSEQSLNGYMSILWGAGTGTAPNAVLGLYTPNQIKPSGATLELIGLIANFGASASALLRQQITMLDSNLEISPFDVLYAGYLLVQEAGTNKTDVGRSATYATNYAFSALIGADQTGEGQWPRAFTGAGTSLTALAASEAMSGVTNAGYLCWVAID